MILPDLAAAQPCDRLASSPAYYEKAAATGYDKAMINLARCYANAIGGRQDVGEAQRLLNKAAQGGSAKAKQILASVDKAKAK